jgi:hypothetical protein
MSWPKRLERLPGLIQGLTCLSLVRRGEDTLVTKQLLRKLSAIGGPNLSVESGPGETLFVGYGSVVHSLTIADPRVPRIMSSFWTSGKAWGLHYSNGRLYVADLRNGLIVLNAANPRCLRLCGQVETPGHLRDVFVRDDLAFLADGPAGLAIADVSDPLNPVELFRDNCWGHEARAVTATERHIYVATSDGQLCVFEVTTPTTFDRRSITNSGLNVAQDIHVLGTHAYMAALGNGVALFDVANPDAPTRLPTWKDPDSPIDTIATGLHFEGQRAYVSLKAPYDDIGTQASLLVLDCSQSPQLNSIGPRARTGAPEDTYAVRVKRNTAYVAHDDAGLRAIDLDTRTAFERSVLPSSVMYDVATTTKFAYVADYYTGLSIVDISNPYKPYLAGSWYRPDYDSIRLSEADRAPRVAVSGTGLVFLARGGQGLYVIDTSTPDQSDCHHPGNIFDVDFQDFLYLVGERQNAATGENQYVLRILSVGDPVSLDLLAEVVLAGSPRSVSIGESVVCVTYDADILAIDVGNPAEPVVGRPLNLPSGINMGVSVHDRLAAVVGNNGTTFLVDVRDISNLTIRGQWAIEPSDNGLSVLIHGSRLYIGYANSGLRVLDVSNPTSPVLTGIYDNGEPIFSLSRRRRHRFSRTIHLVVAAGDMGLWILRG